VRGIIIRRPDDMHFHPRTGEMLKNVLLCTSKVFPRGVVMGNLPKPVTTADDAQMYRAEIYCVDPNFSPIMTIMLTKSTTPQIVKEAFGRGVRVLKYIPNNVSTNSEEGVALTELHNFYPVLKTAKKLGMIFSGHWESPLDESGAPLPEIEREIYAIPFLQEIVRHFPNLKVVVEHATTRKMIQYVESAPKSVGATLTVHHAILNYGSVFDYEGKLRSPDSYCKPIAKSVSDMLAVIEAMTSGNPKFFFGSDSAPHPRSAKEKVPPAAGIFTAPVALPLLCELFQQNNALFKLENFVSRFGAEFYGLPLNEGEIILRRESWEVPNYLGDVRIFRGGHVISWRVA
jgi:dihydroorotase